MERANMIGPEPKLDPEYRRQQLEAKALETFGDQGKATRWLDHPNAGLKGCVPRQLAESDEAGFKTVMTSLGRIQHGIFA
jgi:uncharacterized protein (DUF2384 family)